MRPDIYAQLLILEGLVADRCVSFVGKRIARRRRNPELLAEPSRTITGTAHAQLGGLVATAYGTVTHPLWRAS